MINQGPEAERKFHTIETTVQRLRFLVFTSQEHKKWKNNAPKLQNHLEKRKRVGFLKE